MRDPLAALAAGLMIFGSINAVFWIVVGCIEERIG